MRVAHNGNYHQENRNCKSTDAPLKAPDLACSRVHCELVWLVVEVVNRNGTNKVLGTCPPPPNLLLLKRCLLPFDHICYYCKLSSPLLNIAPRGPHFQGLVPAFFLTLQFSPSITSRLMIHLPRFGFHISLHYFLFLEFKFP